jgi:multisubunit Na+/H+ antiporter MnhB subunit
MKGMDAALNLLSLLTCGILLWAVLDPPIHAAGLSSEVLARMDLSGVDSSITAVLLNFRSYDTFLEVGVLLLAAIGCLTLRGLFQVDSERAPLGSRGLLLGAMTHLLIPMMILIAGYLLWAGGHAPGGAFQAGAVLGAAGILLLLGDGKHAFTVPKWSLRAALALGFCIYLLLALGTLVSGRNLLEFPIGWAAGLILLLETVVTLSIAAVLITLFAINPPVGPPSPPEMKFSHKDDVEERNR